MKIYKIHAKRAVDYYIAVRNSEDPLKVAKENVEDAFYEDVRGTQIEVCEVVDIFDSRLDNCEVYGLCEGVIEGMREHVKRGREK
jgi:hypothetical protein